MGKRGRPRYPDVLTPREQEVLALLREGLTNGEIAERLSVSADTVKTHVSQILSKLGVGTREEAAAWAPEAEGEGWTWRRWVTVGLGTAVVVGAVLVLGLLAWGVIETSDTDQRVQGDAFASPTPSDFSDPFAFLPEPVSESSLEVGENVRLMQGIYRYTPGSGTLIAIASSDEGQSTLRLSFRAAGLSPDGRWLAFAPGPTGSWDTGGVTVYLKDLESQAAAQPIARFPIVFSVSVSPDGSRVFVGTSVRVPDDLVEHEYYLVEVTEKTATKLAFPGGADSVQWSPDGELVSYFAAEAGEQRLFIARGDFSEPHAVAAGRGAAAWSPDGQALAFNDETGLSLFDRSGVVTRVTDRRVDYPERITWSPDGRKVAFTSAAPFGLGGSTSLVLFSLADRTEEVIGNARAVSWSLDGRELAFEREGRLYIRPIEGEAEPVLSTHQDFAWNPTWLGDGTLLFFYEPSSLGSISVVDRDGSDLEHIAYGWGAEISPDGEEIAFIGGVTGGGFAGVNHIFVMNADGSDLRQVARYEWSDTATCDIFSPWWSEDGTEILFVNPTHGTFVSVAVDDPDEVKALGGCNDAKRLRRQSISSDRLRTSPDGSLIAYSEGPSGWETVHVGDPDEPENARPIVRGTFPQWFPDGERLLILR